MQAEQLCGISTPSRINPKSYWVHAIERHFSDTKSPVDKLFPQRLFCEMSRNLVTLDRHVENFPYFEDMDYLYDFLKDTSVRKFESIRQTDGDITSEAETPKTECLVVWKELTELTDVIESKAITVFWRKSPRGMIAYIAHTNTTIRSLQTGNCSQVPRKLTLRNQNNTSGIARPPVT